MAKSRRKAREAAMVALYQLDLMRARLDPRVVINDVMDGGELAEDQRSYAASLVNGIAENRDKIDQAIGSRLADYDIDRVAAIDRALLRIAAYEILFVPELAPAITVNEAVEIAKKYSTAESGRFVNGVLGRLVRESEKANWTPPEDIEPEAEEEAPEPEETAPAEELEAESEEGQRILKHGWKIKSSDESPAEDLPISEQ